MILAVAHIAAEGLQFPWLFVAIVLFVAILRVAIFRVAIFGVLRGYPWLSVAIAWLSVAIRGYPWLSVAIFLLHVWWYRKHTWPAKPPGVS